MTKRSGIAIVNVLIFAVFTTVFLIAGVSFTQAAIKQGRKAGSTAQVYNVALAGITHSVFWLQRQAVQPVTVFDPRANGATVAPDEDPETKADEEQLGLVQEFEIDAAKGLWGRYEVGRSEGAPTRTGVSQVGAHSAKYAGPIFWTAEDVSGPRGQRDQPGSVWRMRSRGYVFTRQAAADAFTPDGTVTRILERLTLEAEVRSSKLNFRAACIYGFGNSLSGQDIAFDEGSDNTDPLLEVLDGTARGYWFRSSQVQNASDVDTLNTTSNTSGDAGISTALGDQLQYVFGVASTGEVKNLADATYSSIGAVPVPAGDDAFIYLQGNFTFNASKRLDGSGILFVDGDLKLDGSSTDQAWEGLIFTTGKFTLSERAVVRGAVMAGKNIFLDAASGKQPKILYSESILNGLSSKLGSYRLERSTLRAVDDATITTF